MGPLSLISNTAGYLTKKALIGVGKGALEVGKSIPGIAALAGKGTVKAADKMLGVTDSAVGTGIKAGKYMARDALAGMNSGNRFLNPAGNALNLADKFGSRLMKYDYERLERNPLTNELVVHSGGLKFTRLGAGIILGAGALAGSREALNNHMNNRIGTIDPKKVTATPEMEKEEYSINNGGATGDLVFALHNNRKG